MKQRPWVRIVFDYPQPASDYIEAVSAISKVADIIGQPSDSTYSSKMSVSAFKARFQQYVTTLPQINIWEICNECNGDWAGDNTPAQTDAALSIVKAAGKLSMFVPYWNTPNCADKHGDYVAWTQSKISQTVKLGTDYVMTSIYGMDCEGPEPTYPQIESMLTTFATMFPNSKVGIGEYGAEKAIDKERIMKYYLNFRSTNPRFIFFGGYWYGYQDLVPMTKPLWSIFNI